MEIYKEIEKKHVGEIEEVMDEKVVGHIERRERDEEILGGEIKERERGMIEIEKERKLENQYCGVYLEVEDRKRNRREMKDFNKKERIVYLCKKTIREKRGIEGK